MERWLCRRLGEDTKDARVRSAWGKAAGLMGLVCNALLFAAKLAAGLASGSVAITADAVNNLSDASSSIVSLLGFKLAERPADREHPYGHGRFEYIAALAIAVMILVIGAELMKSSVGRILAPSPVALGALSFAVLAGSIAVKGWMAAMYRMIGRKTGSVALAAAARDSPNDVITTAAVLLSAVIGKLTGWMIDGWVGAAVAAFILASGVSIVREAITPMLGTMPPGELVDDVRRRLLACPGVLGVHDLMIHDYGPGRQYASVHLELDAAQDPIAAHDLIDRIERGFMEESELHMVIHHDPVVTDDPRAAAVKETVLRAVQAIDPGMTIHDLRLVPGDGYTDVVFDCVVPYGLRLDEEEIRARICRMVAAEHPDCRCAVTLENSLV